MDLLNVKGQTSGEITSEGMPDENHLVPTSVHSPFFKTVHKEILGVLDPIFYPLDFRL